MLFRRTSGENVIHSYPKHWALKDKEITAADYKSEFTEYQGHIVWVGQIDRWWSETKLKPPGTGFYPDPYLIYDRCKVLEHSEKKLVLQGNVSPLNGMAMQKTFELIGDGKVRITISVTNKSQRPVRWNIWSNTRFKPDGKSWFEVGNRGNIQLAFSAWAPLKERPLMYDIKKGRCGFTRPNSEMIDKFVFFGKLSFNKYIPIYAVYKDNLFIKTALPVKTGRCPKGSLPLEIYQRYSKDALKNIMELEFQSPEFTLQPNESYSFTEQWQLKKYTP